LRTAGLDWKVEQQEILTDNGIPVFGYKANVRDSDQKVLGVVSDRYQVVQNEEAFAFMDELPGEGVRYETAGRQADFHSGKASGKVYYCRGRDWAILCYHEFT